MKHIMLNMHLLLKNITDVPFYYCLYKSNIVTVCLQFFMAIISDYNKTTKEITPVSEKQAHRGI